MINLNISLSVSFFLLDELKKHNFKPLLEGYDFLKMIDDRQKMGARQTTEGQDLDPFSAGKPSAMLILFE